MAALDGWPPARGDTGAQNPAYRPPRPPPGLRQNGHVLTPRPLGPRECIQSFSYLPVAKLSQVKAAAGEKVAPRDVCADLREFRRGREAAAADRPACGHRGPLRPGRAEEPRARICP